MKNQRRPVRTLLILAPATRELPSGFASLAKFLNLSRIQILWLIVAIPLAILSCRGDAPADANGAVSDPQSLTYDGLERTYRRYVPPTYDGTR